MTDPPPDPPQSIGRRAWLLSAAAFGLEKGSQQLKQNLRWSFLAATHAAQARSWFAILEGPEFAKFSAVNPRLAFRPLRPYLSSDWSMARRAEVILSTYRIADRQGGALRDALLQPDPVTVAELALPNVGTVDFRLGRDERFRKEGEITLSAQCEALGGVLMSLAFSLEDRPDGRRTCYVGCVQGRGGHALQMRTLTKAMHGLRPRAVMVVAMQDIARALDCTDLRGASDRIQLHHRKHLIDLPFFHSLSASYDEFFGEAGGRLAADGWFDLPLRPSRRAASEIDSKKRSQYARRYAMQDELAQRLERGIRAS